jgi:hypothetical protein
VVRVCGACFGIICRELPIDLRVFVVSEFLPGQCLFPDHRNVINFPERCICKTQYGRMKIRERI